MAQKSKRPKNAASESPEGTAEGVEGHSESTDLVGTESLRQEAERSWAASARRVARKKQRVDASQRRRTQTENLRKKLKRANQKVAMLKKKNRQSSNRESAAQTRS